VKTIAHFMPAVVVVMILAPFAGGQETLPPKVHTCETISLARPGNGVAYSGEVRNTDYRFSTKIPDGLVAWGAGVGAPFHGFTIYLAGQPKELRCIHFTIETHVDLPADVRSADPAPPERRTRVGNRVASATAESGLNNGVVVENRTVSLQLDYGNRRADVSITLVSPRKDVKRTKPVFDSFLSHFVFW
jgi:hypothetical protein